jgi:hypothetical protein
MERTPCDGDYATRRVTPIASCRVEPIIRAHGDRWLLIPSHKAQSLMRIANNTTLKCALRNKYFVIDNTMAVHVDKGLATESLVLVHRDTRLEGGGQDGTF